MGARKAAPARTRKGYTRRDAIPAALRRALDRGAEEPRTLAEWLAIDPVKLLKAVLPGLGLERHAEVLLAAARGGERQGPMDRHRRIGAALWEVTRGARAARTHKTLAAHPCGMVREWAALMLTADPTLTLEQRIAGARRFAADPSMNVREIAWMSYRPYLALELDRGLRALGPWATDPDPLVRRCAIESVRPRGVWCAHLTELKQQPDKGLPLLEAVRADESRYVQLSAANWLNDLSKSDPRWVRRVCARWRQQSPTEATAWIVHHALRTLRRRSGRRAA